MFYIDDFSVNELNEFLTITSQPISLDKVMVCKDCEYRFICINNFELKKIITNGVAYYAKTHECDYNPYIGKFRDEENFIEVSKECKQSSSSPSDDL